MKVLAAAIAAAGRSSCFVLTTCSANAAMASICLLRSASARVAVSRPAWIFYHRADPITRGPAHDATQDQPGTSARSAAPRHDRIRAGGERRADPAPAGARGGAGGERWRALRRLLHSRGQRIDPASFHAQRPAHLVLRVRRHRALPCGRQGAVPAAALQRHLGLSGGARDRSRPDPGHAAGSLRPLQSRRIGALRPGRSGPGQGDRGRDQCGHAAARP